MRRIYLIMFLSLNLSAQTYLIKDSRSKTSSYSDVSKNTQSAYSEKFPSYYKNGIEHESHLVTSSGEIMVWLEDNIDPEGFAIRHQLTYLRILSQKSSLYLFENSSEVSDIVMCEKLSKNSKEVIKVSPNWKRKKQLQ